MENFEEQLEKTGEFGIIASMLHPIAFVAGLPGAHLNEIVLFESGDTGQIFLLEENVIHVLVFTTTPLRVGTRVIRTGRFPSIPVGRELLGKIIDPLGNAFSEAEQYTRPQEERRLDIPPLSMSVRTRIKTAFLTGVTIVDMMTPLGRGQKELVIGDRKTGKSSFLLSSIKSQIEAGGIAIYAAIGKKKADIKDVQNYLKREKLTDKCIIVATSAYDSPSLIYLTPYAAVSVAEYFRDLGIDTVIVLDDLSTHAKFYREVSLLASRFPGRESYPGDIFYTHARLLERAGNFKATNGREVAITMLPVAEVIEGDFTGFIATNLMGMTDGHLYFDSNLYYQGRRPALNIALSVTRVGRQATSKVLRSINRELTAFLTLYDKMQDLSHFGAELTDAVKQVLRTGDIIYKFFEQSGDIIVPYEVQISLFSMLWLRMFDDASVMEKLPGYRLNLIKAYSDPKNKKYFQQLTDAEHFNDLLGKLNKQRELFLTLATGGPAVQKPLIIP